VRDDCDQLEAWALCSAGFVHIRNVAEGIGEKKEEEGRGGEPMSVAFVPHRAEAARVKEGGENGAVS